MLGLSEIEKNSLKIKFEIDYILQVFEENKN